jgi:hypothetical protein
MSANSVLLPNVNEIFRLRAAAQRLRGDSFGPTPVAQAPESFVKPEKPSLFASGKKSAAGPYLCRRKPGRPLCGSHTTKPSL